MTATSDQVTARMFPNRKPKRSLEYPRLMLISITPMAMPVAKNTPMAVSSDTLDLELTVPIPIAVTTDDRMPKARGSKPRKYPNPIPPKAA